MVSSLENYDSNLSLIIRQLKMRFFWAIRCRGDLIVLVVDNNNKMTVKILRGTGSQWEHAEGGNDSIVHQPWDYRHQQKMHIRWYFHIDLTAQIFG